MASLFPIVDIYLPFVSGGWYWEHLASTKELAQTLFRKDNSVKDESDMLCVKYTIPRPDDGKVWFYFPGPRSDVPFPCFRRQDAFDALRFWHPTYSQETIDGELDACMGVIHYA